MIDLQLVEKENKNLAKEFYNHLFYFFIYFCTLTYLYGYLNKNTTKDNNITAMENNFMKYIFILFIVYFFFYIYTKISTWKHRILMFLFGLTLIGASLHYEKSAKDSKSILSKEFLLPIIITIILFNLFIYIAFFRKYTFDLIQPSMIAFNEGYVSSISNLLYSLTVVMIIYVIVFRQYNYNTPSSNTLQPLILGVIVMISLFYFIAKFVIQIGMVKKYNVTNVMISLYLIFSIFVCFYLYTFITSLEKLAKDGPEKAAKREELDKAFESQPKIVQFIQKNIILVILACIVLLYWIRDNIHWNRFSALGYLVLTVMMIYTSKVVAQIKSGLGGALSAIYLVEWLLVTKLRWNSVMNVFNIIFSGIEVSNKDMHTTPVMYVKE